MGTAKANLLRANFGKVKDNCLEALKWKDDNEQCYFVLARSRFFVQKYDECMQYVNKGLEKFPTSAKLHDLNNKCQNELSKEMERAKEIETIKTVHEDKRMQMYRNLRGKKIKLGKRSVAIPEVHDVEIKLDKKGILHFPVVLLYDEFMATDFIQDFPED